MKLHSKKDIFYIYKCTFLILLPLILFGILKNGILLYKETNNMYTLIKPCIFLLVSVIPGIILDYLDNKRIKPGKYLVSLMLLYMISSINTPIWLYIFGNILLILLIKFGKGIINNIAITKVIMLAILYFIKGISFSNIIESSGEYIFSFMDLIIKSQIGGISSCNLILVLVLLIFLINSKFYKREISLISILCYIIYFAIIAFIHNPNIYIKLMINSTALFELIAISTINEYSPRAIKGEIAYGILVGFGSGILCNYLSPYYGVTICIAILSPLKLLFDKNKLFS